jgi:TonB-linked SusC/RagA family outer membrane protein
MRKTLLNKHQLLFIMRVCIFKFILLLVTSSFLYAKETSAQEMLDRQITVNVKDVSLKTALDKIEAAAQVQFSYSRNIINLNQIVTCVAKSETLAKVLQRLLKPLSIQYQVVNDQVLLYHLKKKRTNGDEPVESLSVAEKEIAIKYIAFRGRVLSSVTGQGLPDVSVTVKNTNLGTTTDANGSFALELPNPKAVLVLSYVGYLSQEVAVNNETFLEIKLEQDIKAQDEIVVVGYGTQRSRNVSGAVGRVGAREISQVSVVSADQAIMGRVAGVQINQNSGEPGGEINIRIRGISSLNLGSEPLIVVDGIPLSVNLRAINPNDIESIDVLKDAAASAIYGSRASAGVILITTKRGKAGKVSIAVDAYTGIQNATKRIPVLSGPEYAKLGNENLVNGGQAPNPAWANPASLPTTDWQDAMFRSAMMNNYNVAVSGGNEKARTYLSFGYTGQDGIIRRSNYERYTSRINMDYNVSSKLKLGVNVNFSIEKSRNPQTQTTSGEGIIIGAPNGILQANPIDPVYTTTEGQLGDHLYGFRGYALRSNTRPTAWYITTNPVWLNDYRTELSRSQNTQLLSNAFAELEIVKGLRFKSIISYNISNHRGISGTPYKLPSALDPTSNTSYSENWNVGNQWNWQNFLSYERSFGDHNFSFLAGTDALKGTGAFISGNNNGQPESQQSLSATTSLTPRLTGSAFIPFSLFSYVSRLNYNYREKYILSFNFRRDGSSNFLEENRYGNFPSVSAAWRISEEGFMSSVRFIQDLKLRGSYGVVGNQNIGGLRFQSTYTTAGGRYGYSLGATPALVIGLHPGVLGNPDLSWEKKTEQNIGLDIVMARGMFNFSADYYIKKLTDLLGNVPTPLYSTPYNGSFLANAFSMENKGFELLLGFNKQVGQIRLNASANFTTIKNTVTGLIPGNSSGFLTQSISAIGDKDGAETRTYVGETVGNFWGYIFDGIIQNQAQLDASGMKGLGSKIGDKKFKDINGRDDKGNLTGRPDGKINGDDKTFIGNGTPGYVYGFNLGAEFKGFDFNAFFNGQGDVQIANMPKAIMYHMRFHNGPGLNNVHKDVLNSWNGEGTSNTLPRNSYDAPYINRAFASDYIENGAFLRLRNIQLGYTLPLSISSKARMSRARIYVSAQNLLTFTKYSGYDPEVGNSLIGNRALTSGVDYGRFPAARMFTVGINTQF